MESKEDKLVLGDHPKEIKNPYHIHPFEFKNTQYSVRGHTYSERCRLCHEPCPESYYCKPCNFYLCPTCVKTNPFVVDPRKTHDHQLTFVPKFSFVFTCDACGVGDQKSALCMCIPCSFAIHLGCVSLPRVICINRHDEHRISLRLPLGSGDWICKLCLEKVNGEYGAYSCLTCSDYVVHSKCATHYRVWDGIDLDGVPEEDPEEIMPFKVVEEGVINYFGHEHNLRLAVFEEGETRNKQCSACVLPIYSNPCYVCTDHCDFILHEVCANFLKKKRHPVDPRRFTLSTVVDRGFGYATKLFCKCCNQIINGFYYEADSKAIDVLCASFKDGYVHASHPHLGLVIKNIGACSNCERERSSTECYSMACNECKDFKLCYRCLTLPEVVEHKYDEEHPLSLCYGENNSGSIYWCELCEGKLDPCKWYYTSQNGDATLHTHCVLGVDARYRLGYVLKEKSMAFELVLNNNNVTRPHCHICACRCKGPTLLKYKGLFFCSSICVKGGWVCRDCRWGRGEEVSLYTCSICKSSKPILLLKW